MADITVRLIWYRLGESYKNMADRYERFLEWYEDFSLRRVDILDMLFLGWLLVALGVVGVIHLYLRFFGLPRSRKAATKTGSYGDSTALVSGGETCQWINCVISWISQKYHHTPEFVESWLRALNEQVKRQPGDTQLKFDEVHLGHTPPKISKIASNSANDDSLALHVNVLCTDLKLLISVIQPSATNLKITHCDATVSTLQGQVKVLSQTSDDEIQTNLSFVAPPELKLQVTPRNFESNVDTKHLESVIRNAIEGAVTTVSLSARGGYPMFFGSKTEELSTKSRSSASPTYASPFSNRASQLLRNKKLLVKVIKANGLGDRDFGCVDPFCRVEMDEPSQSYMTSVVKNTVNPFWDEHFIFDVDDATRQVKLEVFDKEKPRGADFLGRAVISITDMRRMPSSRQIIPLTDKPGSPTITSGSVTVEFLFMGANEADALAATSTTQADSLSPRRRIETSQRMTPGGTYVTTSTTTTEKPRDLRQNGSYNDYPSLVEKTEASSSLMGTDYSPYSSPTTSSQLSAHEGALSASQDPRYQVSPMLMVTDEASLPNRYGTMPATTDSSMYDDIRDQYSTSTLTSSDPRGTGEAKKPRSFASAFKKKFARKKPNRSQSADRASSMREASLLKPPDHETTGSHTTEDIDGSEIPEAGLRSGRSRSFSSSLRRLFKKKKKDNSMSRESSVSRASTRSHQEYVAQPSPQLSSDGSRLRQPSPDVTRDFVYSTSVPAQPSHFNH